MCEARRFDWRLIPPTCGRFARGWEVAASTASSCTRKRTASSHPPETIISRRGRYPRRYPRAKCFSRRYCAIILALGKRRVARPLVFRRIGDARIRPVATSDAEMAVSVVPKRARADRCGLRMVSCVCVGGIQAVSFRIPPHIWHVRTSFTFPRPANTERCKFPHRKAATAPLSYKTGRKSTENE